MRLEADTAATLAIAAVAHVERQPSPGSWMPTDTLVMLCVGGACVLAIVIAIVRGKPGFVVPVAEAVLIFPVSWLGLYGMGLTIFHPLISPHVSSRAVPLGAVIEISAGFVGVVALWIAMLVPPSVLVRLPVLKALVTAGLVAGLLVSARILWEWHRLGYGTVTNPATYFIAMPALVAVHQLVRIARQVRGRTSGRPRSKLSIRLK